MHDSFETRIRKYLSLNYSQNIMQCEGIERINEGMENDNYIIFDSQKYVFRRWNVTSFQQVMIEAELLKELNKVKFPTPKLVLDDSNSMLGEIEGKPVAVFEFIEKTGEINQKSLPDIMKVVTKLHVLMHRFKPESKRERFENVEARFINFCNENNLNAKWDKLLIIIKEWLDQIRPFYYSLLQNVRKSWVHHDLNPGNFIQGREQLPYLIDFDECRFGPVVEDLASLFHFWCMSGNGEEIDYDLFSNIISLYDKNLPLKQEEWLSIPFGIYEYQFQKCIGFLTDMAENAEILNMEQSNSFIGLMNLRERLIKLEAPFKILQNEFKLQA